MDPIEHAEAEQPAVAIGCEKQREVSQSSRQVAPGDWTDGAWTWERETAVAGPAAQALASWRQLDLLDLPRHAALDRARDGEGAMSLGPTRRLTEAG